MPYLWWSSVELLFFSTLKIYPIFGKFQNSALHDFNTCLCDRGKAGLAHRAAATEKRKAYYKTSAGIETKKKYREREDVKRKIINQLQSINVSTKAKLCKETIEQLVKLL